ncbi:YifB family Mg chelatase-like AAA ATPase [Alicyclobacillus ferrooxydans]|uniref:AAA+ ATPase domain-containing protein n=1 Tax=Alicyclobacillus ferrooxydans TaxID=471514 RepID=A0A0P9C4S4_9BACL|nr:YifB family Mg chelatase-like AAA ATPase [Alicyclobacillus ferrooxydans]KPV39809.1 hypothetical protein AN477_22200 [Alicyclobacillus ferrooxydans]
MIGVAFGVVLEGISATVVRVEADVSQGLPQFSIVGLPDSAVSESRLRIRAAMKNSGLPFPNSRITVNLSPASLRKRGAGLDLAITMAILNAVGALSGERLNHCGFSAELGLSGRLVPVPGIMNLALSLHGSGFTQFFISQEQWGACLPIPNFTWIGLNNLSEVVTWLRTKPATDCPIQPSWTLDPSLDAAISGASSPVGDMKDVHGLEAAKRGLMIAACGRHHTLLIGPPGCGKTMLAERFSTILPPLSNAEALEVYALHQACGDMTELTAYPPLRAPHHSLTVAGLIGGGSPPMPGEATLAHRGVLILDELLEFQRQTLDSLREPLTTRQIRITRGNHTSLFPAAFILLGTLNPCLCGQLGSGTCTCLPSEVRRYWSRVSGPFFDRMELVITMQPTAESSNSPSRVKGSNHQSSADMRRIVTEGRAALLARLTRLSSPLSDMEPKATNLLETSEQKLRLSKRAADAVVRVARTISVLDGRDSVTSSHLAEALALRVQRPWEAAGQE